MDIIRGKIPCAKKTVIYGPEGIGKSTFASKFPEPLFIDTEGSTKNMDVARTKTPTSWTMLLEQIQYVKDHPDICRTLVIDTIDWAEQMCVIHVCSLHQKKGVEDFNYGKGYVYVKEEFGKFLNRLSDVINAGVNIVLTAHTQLVKFEQPDEMGSYDRYELKLGQKTKSQTSPLVKEWADMLLFANYKTYSIAVDDKGKKHKAQGGKRVMYTAHHPCWDAKNRYGLADELPFEYGEIAHIIGSTAPKKTEPAAPTQQNPAPEPEIPQGPGPEEKPPEADVPKQSLDTPDIFEPDPAIPKALRDLMINNVVLEEEIQKAVAQKGYFPINTPITNYPPGFIDGVLIGAWEQVYSMVKANRENDMEIPFNN
jgi:hypothetical protein